MLPIMLLLLACADNVQDQLSPLTDRDHDGFAETEDCDDLDPAVHPDAIESCDGIDDDCDGQVDEGEAVGADPWYGDADGDGYGDPEAVTRACAQPEGTVANARDCDDTHADASPSGVEHCDGYDNDCDGVIDEGTASDAETFYQDADGDGYGDPWVSWSSCEQPEGFVADDTDCNDDDAAIHPGAAEVCAGYVDEDCDGRYDDDDDDVSDPQRWYQDDDGDTVGDPTQVVMACDQPDGAVAPEAGEDCDDSQASVNPNAAEVCGNDRDDDCDGDVDEEDAPYPVRWYQDQDGDGYGNPDRPGAEQCGSPGSTWAPNDDDCADVRADVHPGATETWYDGVDQDCAGDDDYDADADGDAAEGYGGTDCDDTAATAHPGLIEICGDGLDNDCDGQTDPCDEDARVFGDTAGDGLGSAVVSVGDWNGDGDGDLAVGADLASGSGYGMGLVYLVVGPVSGDHAAGLVARASFEGAADGDRAGGALAGPGDVDADGYDELLVGAVGNDDGGAQAGCAYLLDGPGLGSSSLASDGLQIVGELAGDQAGAALSGAGDVNGDGWIDLLIGAPGQDAGGSASGAVYLLSGPVTADVDLSYADTRLVGASAGEQAGTALAGGGDVNGDGYDDVLVGAPYAVEGGDYTGAAYLLYGPLTDNQVDLGDADVRLSGGVANDLAGLAVAFVGDMDGDGADDVSVGAPGVEADGANAGAAYFLANPASGSLPNEADGILLAQGEDSYLGCALDGAGDVNRDGTDDAVVGARLSDEAGSSDAGAAFLVVGPLSGTLTPLARILGDSPSDQAGTTVAGVPDLDGDGSGEVLVGVPYSSSLYAQSGEARLILGGGW